MNYTISAVPPSNYWRSCPPDSIHLPNMHDTAIVSLGLENEIFCPNLVVNMTSPNLIRCFESTYYVSYTNTGTDSATNVVVQVELDPYLVIDSTTIPYTQTGQILLFNIGTLDVLESGQFQIHVTVDCNASLGETHCSEVTILPNNTCVPGNATWTGAVIAAEANCIAGDSVKFRIQNVGLGDMTQPRSYYVVEDQVLPLQGTFFLQAGTDTTWTKAALAGVVYQIHVEQEITHPQGNNLPSDVAYGCNTQDPNLNVQINQLALNDYWDFLDIDCQENVGSYDPNDKQGFPVGYDSLHYIRETDKLEYLIRFQNTGTFMAFNVVIEDEIDTEVLDLSTLQVQAVSHSYQLTIEGNILKFNFPNIMLPDSFSNEPASHGFIRFKIEQKEGNPIGTRIENTAAIYFDFNEPVITNTTFHTVGRDFILITSTKNNRPTLAELKVFPNPFTTQTTIDIKTQSHFSTLRLHLYDALGRLVKTERFNHQQQIHLTGGSLLSGIYFYQLEGDGQLLNTGKLIVH